MNSESASQSTENAFELTEYCANDQQFQIRIKSCHDVIITPDVSNSNLQQQITQYILTHQTPVMKRILANVAGSKRVDVQMCLNELCRQQLVERKGQRYVMTQRNAKKYDEIKQFIVQQKQTVIKRIQQGVQGSTKVQIRHCLQELCRKEIIMRKGRRCVFI